MNAMIINNVPIAVIGVKWSCHGLSQIFHTPAAESGERCLVFLSAVSVAVNIEQKPQLAFGRREM